MIFGKLYLERVNSNFVRAVSDNLSSYLKANVELITSEITIIEFGEYIKSLPYFTLITVFETIPAESSFILEINPQIIFYFTDRLFGGKGSLTMKERKKLTFSEMVVAEKILAFYQKVYKEVFFDCKIIRQEQQSRIIHTFLPEEKIFAVDYKCYINEQLIGTIHTCFPHVDAAQ